MTASNLSVVFGPTLLRPEEETVASIMDLKFYNIVVEILIDNCDRLFNEPPPSTTYEHPNDDVAPPEAVTRKIKPINGTVSDVSRYTNGPHIPHIKKTNGYGHQDIKAFRTSNLPQQSYHTVSYCFTNFFSILLKCRGILQSVKPAYGFYDNDNSTILQDLSHSEYGGRPASKYIPQTSASQSEINIPNMNWGSPRFGSNPLLGKGIYPFG